MKNYLIKIFSVIAVIFISFFLNELNVKAEYKTKIVCEYEMLRVLSPNIGELDGSIGKSTSVVYTGSDSDYSISLQGPKSTTFNDSGFYKYMRGKGNGSKKNRGDDYRTCPEYVRVDFTGVNYKLDPIKRDTFTNMIKNVHYNSATGILPVGTSNGKFIAATEKASFFQFKDDSGNTQQVGLNTSSSYLALYLKSQTIDGKKENSKANHAIKAYFEDLYGFKNDKSDGYSKMNGLSYKNGAYTFSNILDSYYIYMNGGDANGNMHKFSYTVKEDYLDISNYSFTDYDSFKKYALSDTIGNEKQDKGMSYDDWNRRRAAFFAIDNFRALNGLITSKDSTGKDSRYSSAFADYQSSAYNTMLRLINISSNPKYEEDKNEQDERESSDSMMKNNICSAICTDSTGLMYKSSALTACQSSQTYKKCNECLQSRCKNVSGGELDNCMSGCYGDSQYKTLREKQKKNATLLQELKDTLHQVTAPTLDIKFKQKYVPNCKEFAVFHTLYNILRIIAPILVVLFGTLDYAKAVIASDIEKMEKSKKQFPKRLILLVLFIMVPFIISFLIGTFSSLDTSIAKCIVNGK